MRSFIKKTIIGGLLFLVPLSVLGYIIYRLLGLFYKVALVIDKLIPIETVAGIAIANILAILIFLLICFLLGLLATSNKILGFQNWLERNILLKIPGYVFFKAYTKGMEDGDKNSLELDPVLIHFDDNAQLGFLMEDHSESLHSVYIPGAPNPWSGSVIYVTPDRIQQLDITNRQAIQHLQRGGKDAIFLNELKIKKPTTEE